MRLDREAMRERAEHWSQVALRQTPSNRVLAEELIGECYRRAGLHIPLFVWVRSPLALYREMLTAIQDGRQSVRPELWKAFAPSFDMNPQCMRVWAQTGEVVFARLIDFWREVNRSAQLSLARQLGGNAEQESQRELFALEKQIVPASIGSATFAFYETLSGLTKKPWPGLDSLARISEEANSWAPFEKICFVCEHPKSILLDERGRLHSAQGPAVSFRDDWDLYMWHGVQVPSQVIEAPDLVEADTIIQERNAEVRRAIFESIGYERILERLPHKTLHSDGGNKLISVASPDQENLVIVEVTNSTPEPDGSYKRYWIRVPPSMNTVKQAVAWTFDLTAEDYVPERET